MKELVKVHKNGTKVWAETMTCDKCGGSGTFRWGENGKYSGTCYRCEGTGKVTIRSLEFTPEHEAELLAKKRREADKRAEENAEMLKRIAEKEAEEERMLAEKKAAEEARKAISQYQGKVGEKITVRIVEAESFGYEGKYGWSNVHTMRDADGNVYKWFSSASLGWWEGDDWIAPEEFTLTGTVKDHSEYKGEKQTVMTRCKVKK